MKESNTLSLNLSKRLFLFFCIISMCYCSDRHEPQLILDKTCTVSNKQRNKFKPDITEEWQMDTCHNLLINESYAYYPNHKLKEVNVITGYYYSNEEKKWFTNFVTIGFDEDGKLNFIEKTANDTTYYKQQ